MNSLLLYSPAMPGNTYTKLLQLIYITLTFGFISGIIGKVMVYYFSLEVTDYVETSSFKDR